MSAMAHAAASMPAWHDMGHVCVLQKAKVQDMERQLGEQAVLLRQLEEDKQKLQAQCAQLQQRAAQQRASPQQQLAEAQPGAPPSNKEVPRTHHPAPIKQLLQS